ncbi:MULTISPECIES: Crp/Fnr family transcriptional regulator [unclassified Roseateles]|uniref:Crp/Fnr family transcriptional regulator n=1 Tax=unclassified Roseateles TaxID=2626991 RepID=UPI0009E6B0EC|nr:MULTISPECIES: Crp/Fnr family transcriptional regulator [unclassified Roseateles]
MKVNPLPSSGAPLAAAVARPWLPSPAAPAHAVLQGAGHAVPWRQNHLLAALSDAHHLRWPAPTECVHLRQGQTLHEAGEMLQWVYFPVTALVSLSMQDRTGEAIDIAAVGREGVVGLPLLDGNYTRSRAAVQLAGSAIRMPALTLAEGFAREPAVRELLLAYSQALVAQVMQTALCSRHHALEQQLCRLILLRADQQDGAALSMTQETMATMLGVRRESVTLAAARLQQAGLIRYARGQIEVLGRQGLQARACDCYGVIRREFDRLLRPRPVA